MKNAILQGRLHAENQHVRFDGGVSDFPAAGRLEGAVMRGAKPRRESLFCVMMSVIRNAVLSVIVLGHAGFCIASVQDAGTVETMRFQLETAAWQKKIDVLFAQGGGTLVVPKGIHPTGALFFRPGVKLHLEEGAVLLGSDHEADYPKCKTRIEGETCCYYPALINADNCDGFAITGSGTIDGHGFATWEEFWRRLKEAQERTGDANAFRNKDLMRPRVLYVSNSRNVDISGVTFKNSKFWTTHFYQCEDVTVHDCCFLAEITKDSRGRELRGPSTDAVDIDKCRNFTVRDCRISVNDDGVVVKGGKGAWANDYAKHPENGPSSNVLVEDCVFLAPTHSCLTLGSECPEAHGVAMRNCRMDGVGDMLCLKMRTDTPQCYSDILVEDMTGNCKTLLHAGAWTQYADFGGRPQAELKSYATNVVIRNCHVNCREVRNVQENPDVFELAGLKLENNETGIGSEGFSALVGDGCPDDTAAIQARPDSGAACACLPPAKCQLVSKPLMSQTYVKSHTGSSGRMSAGGGIDRKNRSDYQQQLGEATRKEALP